jgi:hypothetical protein
MVSKWKLKTIPRHTHEREQAVKTGFSLHTLRSWRRQGRGQAYIILGREVFYLDADEQRWLESLRVMPVRSSRQVA